MAKKNTNLCNARTAKNDEFYTQLSDIEKEMAHYKDFFKGKIVYCNCDDARESNFFKFFSNNFESLGLKKLITTGYKENGKGVILEQGFEDETNSTKVVDPGYAWIIPTGADSKPVKIAFEGDTLVDEEHNRADWSREIHVYKKVGVVAMLANNICAYCDTSLVGQMNDWFLNGVTGNVMTYDGRASK